MKTRCIKAFLEAKKLEFELLLFELNTEKPLKEHLSTASRSVLLVRIEEIEHYLQDPSYTQDRGDKHKSISLSDLLLKNDKVPVIRGSHTSAGQLRRSCRVLLENAREIGESNTYILAIQDALFDEMWESLNEKGKKTDKGVMALRGLRPEDPDFAKIVLSLLPYCDIPEKLEKTYVGHSYNAKLVRHQIVSASKHDFNVLLLGDTGTGKEVAAHAIHENSDRKNQSFVTINCGTIPAELFEAELFGYKKGAFTGAVVDKEGLWLTANNGTLFLDEIGDLSLYHQVKILRVLEDGIIRPLGTTQTHKVNARVLAATNKNLQRKIESGEFREDLYFRLITFQIHTPPIRNHPEDIPEIANFFWQQITGLSNARLPQDILNELKIYLWPGNGREMRAVLTELFCIYEGMKIGVDQLRTVFSLQGRTLPDLRHQTARHQLDQHQADCYRHLHRVIEVCRAIKVTLRPIILGETLDSETRQTVNEGVRNLIAELEIQCLSPLLFNSKETFDKVSHINYLFRGILPYLASNVKKAKLYWEEKIAKKYAATEKAIFSEVKNLIS